MITVLKDRFETKIGVIEICINCDSDYENEVLDGLKAETINYKIIIKTVDLKKSILPDNMKIDSSKGWRIYIEKETNYIENLIVICKLINPTKDTIFSSDCGENLDAVLIENEDGNLHIGTEDGEKMRQRSENDNWFPKRLKNFVSLENPITEFIDYGFITTIPHLKKSEKIYLHFLIAANYEIGNLKNELSTWFAVERSKEELDDEKYIC